jgi:hypothetical protein
MSVNFNSMKPGDIKVVRREEVFLVQAHAQSDEPPGRNPVELSYLKLAVAEDEVLLHTLPEVIERVVRRS